MEDFDEFLDIDGDGEVGAFEMSVIDEERERGKGNGNNSSGCCVTILAIGSSILATGWCVIQVV